MSNHLPPTLKKFAPAKQRRLDALLEKNAEGKITASEKTRLEALVAEAERLMVSNARLLVEFSKSHPVSPPSGAVPVTVWVKPEHAGP
ncbi:MAG: hypothetical protein K8T91_05735 [Planctomycetes bacterium]|nr:hypothetical protein [Planctomycetota bacterium]